MKTLNQFTGLVLILITLGFQPARFVSPASRPVAAAQVDCEKAISQLEQAGNWFDRLVDPVLDTQARIDEQLRTYSQVHDCIPVDTSDENLKSIRKLTEYFLIFAGGYQTPLAGSKLYLVNLATSNDPAVTALRQKVAINPPAGYVYVRYYFTRQAMPGLVNLVFENPDVRGVTIYTRYVAVLADSQALRLNALPKSVSHELVHAYLKSDQGPNNLAAFPTWYDEGMAIYFSGSSEPSCLTSSNGELTITSCETSPEEYLQYAANFEFLEAKLGQEKFLKVINYSFEKTDPAILYESAGFATYQDFAVRAGDWKKWHDFLPRAEVGSACLVPLVVGLLFYFWKAGKAEAEETPEPPADPDLPNQSL